ncbi:hypothetical protein QK285_01405 [Pseudarthrobacter sp. AL20]|nr:hypothetical protein [Pseudarthrobacter sp. AL20]MDI3193136.1 hypothetical protein [Pseudarthrobacter sp. AL20]
MGHRLCSVARTRTSAGGRAQYRVLEAAGGLPRHDAGQGIPGRRLLRHLPGPDRGQQ